MTTAVGLDTGVTSPDNGVPGADRAPAPADRAHAQELRRAARAAARSTASFIASCNTTFGQIGLDLGDPFVPGMARFGIDDTPPLDVAPGAVQSLGPVPGTFQTDMPQLRAAPASARVTSR